MGGVSLEKGSFYPHDLKEQLFRFLALFFFPALTLATLLIRGKRR